MRQSLWQLVLLYSREKRIDPYRAFSMIITAYMQKELSEFFFNLHIHNLGIVNNRQMSNELLVNRSAAFPQLLKIINLNSVIPTISLNIHYIILRLLFPILIVST